MSFFVLNTGKSHGKKIFLYAGRIGAAQGLDVLIKGAALTKNRPDISYEIVGDGPELSALKRLADELKLMNLVFHEPVPLHAMPQVLGRAYSFVVTLKNLGLFEGTRPAKIMPAIASGLPVIYSGSGEGARLVQGIRAGIVVPPEDEQALAEAVIWLADHEEEALLMGRRGRKFAEDQLDWNVLVERWLFELEKKVLRRGITTHNDKEVY